MNKQIERIVSNFDFEKVHAYMVLVNWTYRGAGVPPSVQELIGTAYDVLEMAMNAKNFSHCATGGFVAVKAFGSIHLYFNLESGFTGLDW